MSEMKIYRVPDYKTMSRLAANILSAFIPALSILHSGKKCGSSAS